MTYCWSRCCSATRADGFLYAVLVALGSVVAYNFFFTAPRYTFHAYSLSAPIIFAFLLIGTLGASSLAIRLKRQATTAARRAYRTEVLLESSREFQAVVSLGACLETAAAQVVKILDRPVVMYQVEQGGRMAASFRRGSSMSPAAAGETPREAGSRGSGRDGCCVVGSPPMARPPGATTDTLREARCLYLPIRSKDRVFGVAGLVMEQGDDDFGSFERNLLVALLDECGQAAELWRWRASGRTSP